MLRSIVDKYKWRGVEWRYLSQDTNERWVLVNTVMNFCVVYCVNP
jgi:hypothetical protein